MTKKQNRAVQRYVNGLLPMLGLSDWAVDVFEEALEPDDAAMATVVKHHGRKAAFVWFRDDFFAGPPDYQRHVIIHELLHCAWAGPEGYVYETLPAHLPGKQHALISDSFRLHQEYSIDGLAVALAPLFPIPAWSDA